MAGHRAGVGGGILRREPPPGKYKFSDYPIRHVIFRTPVGSFWILADACEACRKANIEGLGTKDSPITMELVDRGPTTYTRY